MALWGVRDHTRHVGFVQKITVFPRIGRNHSPQELGFSTRGVPMPVVVCRGEVQFGNLVEVGIFRIGDGFDVHFASE